MLTGVDNGPFALETPLVTANGPTRLAALLHGGRPVLFDASALAGTSGWSDRVTTVRVEAAGFGALLIRPDGLIAWSDAEPLDALRTALARWFG